MHKKNLITPFAAPVFFSLCLAMIAGAQQPFPSGEPVFPYEAIVLAERATVYSGPGSVHYPTDELEQGRRVEVYRHDPDGWCAIRPPYGSFSLVPESTLRMYSLDLGEVLEPDTRAWVGTRLGAVDKPLWQIKLDRGEEVEVFGEVSWPDAAGHSTVWFQIAPPAGEFRWVRMSDLQLPDRSLTTPLREQAPDRFADSRGFDEQIRAPLAPPNPMRNQRPVAGDQRPEDRLASGNNVQRGNPNGAIAPRPITGRVESFDTGPRATPPSTPQIHYDSRVHAASASTDQIPEIRGPRQAERPEVNEGWRRSAGSPRIARAPSAPSASSDTGGFTASTLPGRVQGGYYGESPDRYASLDSSVPRFQNQDERDSYMRDEYNVSPTDRPSTIREAALPENSSSPTSVTLRQLDAQLSRMMVETPGTWELEPLRDQAERLARSAVDMGERAYAERLQEKLRNCFFLREQFRREFGGSTANTFGPTGTGEFGTGPAPGSVSASGTGPFRGGPGQSASGGAAATGFGSADGALLNTTYDAYGWLNELVHSNGNGTSTFVLQDENGKITHHIAAAPGLNLRSYLKQRIGVIGQRGFNNRLKLDHVTAERVIDLKRTALR